MKGQRAIVKDKSPLFSEEQASPKSKKAAPPVSAVGTVASAWRRVEAGLTLSRALGVRSKLGALSDSEFPKLADALADDAIADALVALRDAGEPEPTAAEWAKVRQAAVKVGGAVLRANMKSLFDGA